jgi:gliding motility-associated-like protein
VKLVVTDTIIGCSDSTYAAFPLMAPLAKGLFTPTILNPCPGPELYKTLSFDVNQSQPNCFKYAWWVMWDSLAAVKSGNFNANWQLNSYLHNYLYGQQNGDSAGNVSIGLIVENGLDTNGVTCRDTGWFHHVVNVSRMTPLFNSNYDPAQYYCPGTTFRFYSADSNQVAGTTFLWNFGDGTVVTTNNLKSIAHTFKKAGKYRVHLTVTDPNGCRGDTALYLKVGVYKNFTVTPTIRCVGDTFKIVQLNRYYDTIGFANNFWGDTLRAKAGKEQIKFDLGNGLGYQNLGPNPKFSYAYPGLYPISMLVSDSLGCWDTLSKWYTLSVSGVYAEFVLPKDSFLCAQTIDLTSTATTVDSTVNKGLPGDAIVKYQWDFGAKYAPSFVQNPRRFFSIGNFNIKLKVTNKYGCIDSITHPLVLIGPQAAFDFVGDTIGCEPLLITFKNKSKFATDYIWQFNDATKNAFATKSDTNISFVYRGNGNFYPTLTARGLFTKNGLSQVCDDIYPDTSTQLKRTVTLWELPKPDFKWVTDCKNSTTTFANTSFISTGSITFIQWNFGDGSTSNSAAPTHSYADTGSYQVVLKATSDHGCVDSVVKTVVISPVPTADFSFTKTCLGALTNFSDLSLAYNDRIYQWNWEFGNGNTSGLKNPAIKYLTDTTFNVKLKVMNVAGCADSIVKQITIYSHAKPDFTFTNVCDKSRMFFGNFTTSKQVVTGVEWQFGDGDTSMHWSTDHLYNSIGNYNVQLKAVTEFGCIDSISKTVTIYPNPKAGIAINSKGQCFRNNDFLLTDTTTIASGSTTSNWLTGDAGTSTSKSFNHTYKNTGRYYIQLISVSNFNCADTLSDSVDVYEMPVAKFGIDKKVQCFNYNLFNFSDSSKIAVGSYTVKWLLGNGDTGTGTKFQYHYKDSGVYNTAISVTSNFGCADTTYTQVNLLSMPGAFFTINDSIQCFKRHQFLFTGRNKSASYTWDFGDNYVNNGANPVPYSYQKTGTYKVLLKQTNSNNCTDTFTSTVVILHSPDALFKITDSLQCLYQNNFAFTNKSTIGKGTLTYTWRFGDGDSALTTNASHAYKVASTYTVSLIALSDLGCPDTLTQPVVVHPMPLVIPKVNAAFACINGQNIQFGDSSTIQTGSISPTWKFGDNTVSSLRNPSKKYASAQAFTVWLIETSDFGCADSASIKMLLNPKPNPSFLINDTGQCLNANNFVFTNKSVIQSGTITSKWNFGNGASQTAQNAFQNYLNYGTYRVTLLVTSDSGCVDSSYVDVVVHPMPIAGFSVNAREQCLKGNQFQFTNNSSIASGSLNYKWRFGDTAKSTQSAPSHTYGSFGTFMVWLKATSGFGCTDSINDFMLVDPMPQVRFVTNDSTQCFNIQNFVFTDSSKIASGSLSRNWSLSDGFTATTSTVNRVFADDTTYTVKLVQISDRGCSDSISKVMEVYSNPKSNFVINDTDQCLKQNNFVFTNTSTLAKGNLTHLWKFGDLQTSTITGPAHRYFAYGNFTVTLISTTDNGCVDSIQKVIRVDAMPVVSFTINDTGQCINYQNFIFTNKSSIAVGTLQYLWKFGDATTSNLINPTKQFPVDTLYRVLLTATSNKGCKDSSSKIIDVHPRPYSNFTINDSIQCLRGNNFIFTNKAKIQFKVRAGTLSYNWRLGDGNTSTSTNINHTYTNNGNFNVWLRATSDLGCVDSAFKVVTIGAMPNPSFTVNDPGQCFKINNFGFTNKSSIASGTQSYFWKFGDTDTLRATNASHVYKAIGTFNPRLIATSNYGCIDSVSVAIIVNPNAKASFTVNDSDQCINNQNFIFNNTSTVSSGQVVKWLYSFGNGQFGNQAQSKGVFRNSGVYTIILQTTTDSGCVDSFSKTIRVYPKPKAAFAINDSMQCLRGNYFVFRNRSMDSIGLQSFLWNINDESLQILDSAVYSFKSDSVKNITLIVNSIVGCADTITRQVTVKPMPDPSFQPLNLFYCINSGTYPLSPKTPGGTFLGKNVVSNQYVPTNLWEDTVIYRVTVNGCTDSSSRFTNVYPGPNAFLGNDTVLCKYEALELRVNSWSSKYVWNTGSDRQYIKVTDPGTYSVIVTNACGIDYDTIIVQFRTVNCRLFLANAFTPNGDGINDFYKPVTNNVAEMEYEIFNRWGEKIFIGTLNDAGWDGTCRGEPVQEDAYLVVITYTYSSADHFFKLSERGTVILMR